jgi:nucleoside-diphosphate-sugar epimerase
LKILITGANGFLGKIIYQKLSPIFDITTLARRDSDYNIDLSSEQNINFTKQFDLVIHLAGKAHLVSKTSIDIDLFFNNNVKGTKNLLNAFINNIPKQFVFISSVSVYGLIEGEYISETTSLLAQDPYGKSKIEAESIVIKWCEEHNVICTILRLPLVVGENPPGNLGSMIRGIKKGYYFNVAGGNAKKSMVLASDIAKFILKAAEVGGIYNLTDGIHPTFNELSKSISQNLDKSFVPNMPLSLAKILAVLGNILGDAFPINSNKLFKITSTLTFDDSNARMAFGWKPSPVLDFFKIQHDVK